MKRALLPLSALIAVVLITAMVPQDLQSGPDASTQRKNCLDNCGRYRNGTSAGARMYASCVQECESKFWKEFEKESGEDKDSDR
ncbi:MAG: hypothetical protein V2B18_07510 [Pseudomonadota bacterium]